MGFSTAPGEGERLVRKEITSCSEMQQVRRKGTVLECCGFLGTYVSPQNLLFTGRNPSSSSQIAELVSAGRYVVSL